MSEEFCIYVDNEAQVSILLIKVYSLDQYIIVNTLFSSPKFVVIAVAFLALFVIPITIIQVQNQQNLQQQADEVAWLTDQSASTTCPDDGEGVEITASFSNTEPRRSNTDMNVVVKDQQTGKTSDMGTVRGGETKTVTIQTEKTTLNAGSVTFTLKWTDGHSGVDTRTASYKAVSNCTKPTDVPTPTVTPTPLPSGVPSPTPTICPTLGPVKNVTIECPNCP